MKKFIILTVLMVLSCSFLVKGYSAPNFDIVLIQQTPSPVEPGKNVKIEIEIQNNGYGEANDVIIKIVEKSPFELLTGEDNEKKFSFIGAQDSVKTSYEFNVNSEALTNDYEVEFRIYTGSSSSYISKKIDVSVQGDPELILTDSKADKEIEPGGIVNLTVNLKNIGAGKAKHLKLLFTSTDILKPVFSKGLIYLEDLLPGETKQANLEISIDPSAEHKTYTTTLTAQYLDENNDLINTTFDFGVPVTGSINLEIIKIEPDYDRDTLKFEIANKGTTEAKSVEVKLIIDDELLGVDYTSSIKANKERTFSFSLKLKGQGQLILNYITPNLEKREIKKDIILDYSGAKQNNSWVGIVVVVVILVIGYYFFRKRKK